MLEQIPSKEELQLLVGMKRFQIWSSLCEKIESLYDMEPLWNSGGKAWQYEFKYRRGQKTLCALYAKENHTGFMVIFGKEERKKFEAAREGFSKEIQEIYDNATTYHDGKWMMFDLCDPSIFDDFIKLLTIKRKPNKK